MADKITYLIGSILDRHRWRAFDLSADACTGCDWRGPTQADHTLHVAEVLAAELRAQIPSVAYKGPDTTDVDAFRDAAAKLDTGYQPGGGNTTYAVSRLLRQAAIALEGCTPDELEARAQRGWGPR